MNLRIWLVDVFAHGQLFRGRANAFPPIVGLADTSPRATMLRNGPSYRDTVIDPEYRLAVSIWSDDFEPRNYSKLNKYQKANIYFTCVVESIVINVS